MADLYETRAVLSRAKLTQSTLTDIHIPTQFLCFAVWTQAKALEADSITHPTRHTVILLTAKHYRTDSALVVKHFVGRQRWGTRTPECLRWYLFIFIHSNAFAEFETRQSCVFSVFWERVNWRRVTERRNNWKWTDFLSQ